MSEKKDGEELVEFTYRGVARKGYPEVAAYLNHRREGYRQHQDIRAEADYEYRKAERVLIRAAEDEGRQFDSYGNRQDRNGLEALQSARQVKYEAANAAQRGENFRQSLLQSSHKEVAFIARKALFAGQGDEVEGYARDILAILPATTSEIWAEAKDNQGMCDVFDRFYDAADEEGIFSDGEKLPGRRELAALRSYIRRNYGGSYVGTFMEKITPILKAYEDDYQAKLTAAKAEWQGLDEAWRSERSRRGAATRAANAVAQAREELAATDDEFEREDGIVETRTVTTQPQQTFTVSPAYVSALSNITADTVAQANSFESVSETEEKVNA